MNPAMPAPALPRGGFWGLARLERRHGPQPRQTRRAVGEGQGRAGPRLKPPFLQSPSTPPRESA